jgi:hypothetical protein
MACSDLSASLVRLPAMAKRSMFVGTDVHKESIRAFVDALWGIRVARRSQPSRAVLAKQRVDVVVHHCNHRPEGSVTVMAGEKDLVPIARQNAERRIVEAVGAIHTLEIEDAGVERERLPHIAATNGRDDRHSVFLNGARPSMLCV